MNNFSLFMKGNKKIRENVLYPATASLCDENGKPLNWVLKPLTTEITEQIREDCTKIVNDNGKRKSNFNNKLYLLKMCCASVVEPDLYNVELQNSYGVMTPEDLIMQMIDNPSEYMALVGKVQEINGYDVSFSEKVDEAKN